MRKRPIDEVKARISKTFGAWIRTTSLQEMRADFEAMLAYEPPCHQQPVVAGGIPAAWVGTVSDGPVIMYFHGGGYQIGSIKSHLDLMGRISQATGFRVLGFDYRLAPEHRFPAAITDAITVYRWLLETGQSPKQIAFAGDSAGAGLAVATMLKARSEGLALPAAATLLSPWFDMEATGESFTSRAHLDPMTQRDKLLLMARTYLGREGDPRDPLASPIHGDLAGLVPMQIHVGDHETVLDDTRTFARLAQAAGTDVSVIIWAEMIHHFQIFPELEESARSLEMIAGFLKQHLL
ncbi:MAG: alpha/beta hydrolase [Rhizobiaceae bacterium]|nr:alpha/beta hydrolase [Rhizobiaceae bacterium]